MTERALPTDFEAAGTVAAALQDLPKARQELVLRWVAESLGIVASRVDSLVTPAPSPATLQSPAHVPAHHPPAHQIDIASFVASKQPKSDIQFVTVVAYYHRFVAPEAERKKHITVELAQDATRLADWDRLTNPGSTLNNAKNQGYLDSAGHGKFSVNTVGENLVARALPSPAHEAKGSKTKKKAGAKKKATRSK